MSETLAKKNHTLKSFAAEVVGTEHEVWLKLLRIRHKNRAMTEDEWFSHIEKLKKEKVS